MAISKQPFQQIVYVFQGGGALGAYQVGVFDTLTRHGYHPTWMVGTSIGAINAAIIAGNQPNDRLLRLKEFWEMVSHAVIPGCPTNDAARRWYNFLSSQSSLFFGRDAFFNPRIELLWNFMQGKPDTLSYYDINPLKKTLNKLIDFDLINQGHTRLTLGAVEISQGRNVYFDNTKDEIKPEHILASCALPPGFPAVKIGKNYYWDGGIISNSPAEVVVRESLHVDTLCFMANLFDSFGLLPESMDDVLKRYKDILYSAEYRSQIQSLRDERQLYAIINYLYHKLDDKQRNDPFIKKNYDSQKFNLDATLHFVRFLYTAPNTELSSKDYEFSRLSVDERFATGMKDAAIAIQKSPWLGQSVADEVGVAVHEICSHPTLLEIMDKDKEKNQNITKAIYEKVFD